MTTLVRTYLEEILPGDTCDRCPAQALLSVLIGNKQGFPVGELMFCKHHGDENEKALNAQLILDVIDNRGDLEVDLLKERYTWIEDLLQ